MVSALGPLFRTVGHTFRTQHGVSYRQRGATARRRGDQELHPGPGWQPEPGLRPQHLASLQNERFGSSSHPQQNGRLTHLQDIDAPLHIAAQRKINRYRRQYADNQNIPAVVSTSPRMHGEFLRLLDLQAHRETEAHFAATGVPSQRNQSDSFRFKRAAFFQSLKSKVTRGGQSGDVEDQPQYSGLWRSRRTNARSFTRSSSSPPPSFTQYPFPPRH